MFITALRSGTIVIIKVYLEQSRADKDWIFTFMVQVDRRGTIDYPVKFCQVLLDLYPSTTTAYFLTCLVDGLMCHFMDTCHNTPSCLTQDDTRLPHGPRVGATTAQTSQGYNPEKLLIISPPL